MYITLLFPPNLQMDMEVIDITNRSAEGPLREKRESICIFLIFPVF
jgi:hypothetical protein